MSPIGDNVDQQSFDLLQDISSLCLGRLFFLDVRKRLNEPGASKFAKVFDKFWDR